MFAFSVLAAERDLSVPERSFQKTRGALWDPVEKFGQTPLLGASAIAVNLLGPLSFSLVHWGACSREAQRPGSCVIRW